MTSIEVLLCVRVCKIYFWRCQFLYKPDLVIKLKADFRYSLPTLEKFEDYAKYRSSDLFSNS